MFKLDRKLVLSASAIAAAAVLATGCNSGDTSTADASHSGMKEASHTYDFNNKKVVDGGMYYPVMNGKTSEYRVAMEHGKAGNNYGYARAATKAELEAWDKDVTPFQAPPPGQGSVEEGDEIYEEKCVMCHGDYGSGGGGYPSLSKGNAYDLQKTLTNNRLHDPEADGPTRVFGSYWPVASTLWWYIQDGMPHPKTKSLTDDETYALVAYILSLNEITIDGEELDDEYVLDQEKFQKIVMPNRNGFEPNIDGPNGQDNTRAYFNVAKNFGAQNLNQGAVRCMTNCQEPTVKTVHVKGAGISDFLPPMNVTRDWPEAKEEVKPGQKAYEASCAVCHGAAGMGAPVVGDKAAWAAVTEKGMDSVYSNAINGTEGGMPPKGGNMDLTDAQMKEIIDYMVGSSK